MEADRSFGNRPPGIDQALEDLAAQHPAVDHPDPGDGDHLVAFGGLEAGGLGVEHHEVDLAQRPRAERARDRPQNATAAQQVEVVEFGPRRQFVVAGFARRLAGGGHRHVQSGMARPRLAAMGLAAVQVECLADAVAARCVFDRIRQPGIEHPVRNRFARPGDVDRDAVAGMHRLDVEGFDATVLRKPLDQCLDGQHQRVAVAIEPQRDAGHGDLDTGPLGQMARDPGDQVGGMDLGHGPASAGQGAAFRVEALESRAQLGAVVPDRPG